MIQALGSQQIVRHQAVKEAGVMQISPSFFSTKDGPMIEVIVSSAVHVSMIHHIPIHKGQ